MAYDLASMKLLARGGQADIYEIDSGRVLRVLRGDDPKNTKMLMAEQCIMARLRERGVGVPEVYEYVEVGGQPALEMERVSGPSLLDLLTAKPFGMPGIAEKLANLHAGFLSAEAPDGLSDIKERAGHLAGLSNLLDDEDKAFIRTLLEELPEGSALMHGDFHPGNILTMNDGYYIIDWFGATRGDPASDVAHTYLLCADKPRIPGENWAKHCILRTFAAIFGGIYLRHIRSKLGFGMEPFGKWLAVRAAERTVYGQPSERQGRAGFVKACRRARANAVSSDTWHKLL